MATIKNAHFMNNWHSTMFYTYLKIKPGVDAAEFSKLISRLADKYVKARLDAWGRGLPLFPSTGPRPPSGNAPALRDRASLESHLR